VTTSETPEETTTTTTTAITHIAYDEELCKWAINDYQKKTGVLADKAEIDKNSKEQYNITLLDEAGNVLDTYVINPDTGIGVNSDNEEVNLPQTGNNSMMNILIALGAALLMGFGFYTVKISGVINRKKNEK